ncbi:MAG: hypothetical protein ACLTCI_06065 [[Clostridium] nexile]
MLLMEYPILQILRQIQRPNLQQTGLPTSFFRGQTTCSTAKGSSNIFPYQGKLYGILSDEDGTRLVVSEFDVATERKKITLSMKTAF